jgi:hypothetical protein
MRHILRGLSGGHLECGCLVGIYETYDGRVVAIVDADGKGCVRSSHKPGLVLPTPVTFVHSGPASFAPCAPARLDVARRPEARTQAGSNPSHDRQRS